MVWKVLVLLLRLLPDRHAVVFWTRKHLCKRGTFRLYSLPRNEPPCREMDMLLLFVAAELALNHALYHYQKQLRGRFVRDWREGKLSEGELRWLKDQHWFRSQILKPVGERVPFYKKEN